MKAFSAAAAICGVLSIAQHASAQSQPKGFIQSVNGEECSFTQFTSTETYFHGTHTAETGTLTFDDPQCMSAEGAAKGVNEMMIANFITRPYSHADAAFMTRPGEFMGGSMLQKRGICIQSSKYPVIGVVADFQTSGDYIVGVKHATAVNGCRP